MVSDFGIPTKISVPPVATQCYAAALTETIALLSHNYTPDSYALS